MPNSVMNLVIQTERSSIYYPTEKPVVVNTTVDVNVDIQVDPNTQEIIIIITNANSLDPSTIPIISNPDYNSDFVIWVDNNTLFRFSTINLRNSLYTPGSHITITNGVIAFDTTTSVNFVAVPTAPTLASSDNSTNIATTAFVHSLIASATFSLDVKDSVRALATTNINLSNPGVTQIDGVTLNVGDRLSLIGQTTASENGIYIWNGSSSALTRSPDANSSPSVTNGLFFFVTGGTVNANTGWLLITPDPIILNTTPLSFTQFTGLSDVTAGLGLIKTGNQLSVDFTIVAALASPAFTGTPTAPTQSTNDDSTSLATTAYVQNNLVFYAPLASPALTGTPTTPTPNTGSNTSTIANTAYVHDVTSGITSISSIGGTTNLTSDQYDHPIIIVTGTLLSDATMVMPNQGTWTVFNRTTGAHTLTFKTAAGTGVIVDQSYSLAIVADGTNVVAGTTDFNTINLLGSSTSTTPPPGDNSTRIATTAFVSNFGGAYLPLIGGVLSGPGNLEVDGFFTVGASGADYLAVSADGTEVQVNSAGGFDVFATNAVNIQSGTSLNLFSGTDTTITSQTTLALTSTGNTVVDADNISLNPNNTVSITPVTFFVASSGTSTIDATGGITMDYNAALSITGQGGTIGLTSNTVSQNLLGNWNTATQTLSDNSTLVATTAYVHGYVDSVVQGLDVKLSVRLLSTSNINLSNPGNIQIDSVTPANGDRIGIIGQSTASQNGIYIWNGTASALTRAPDASVSADVTSGMFFWVTEGTVNADSGWILITHDPIVLDTTPLTFTQFSGAALITAGTGLLKSGNVISVDFTVVAALASPAFTGTPTAPTPGTSDNSTKLATTAYVKAQTWGYAALPSELANAIVTVFLDTLQDNHAIYYCITQNMQVPANFAGAVSYSGTNSSGTAVFNISYIRSGSPTSIGTITFTNASKTGTLSTQASVNLLVGDILVITQPHPLDALLAMVGISLVLTKQ